MSKKFFTFILSLAIVINFSSSQSGWFWQNPLPQGNDLHDVKIFNNGIAFACGSAGSVVKSSNFGVNWNTIRIDSGFVSRSFSFINENVGWIASAGGDDGLPMWYGPSKILKTTNGGINFVEKVTFENSYVYSIEFTCYDTGYVLFQNGTTGFIYKTVDNGEHWSQTSGFSNTSLYDSYFTNNKTGYVGGTGIYKTTNGGINWQNQLNNFTVSSIFFVNEYTGFAAGSSYGYPAPYKSVFKTTNAGSSWISTSGSFGTGALSSVYFLNTNLGYTCGSGVLFRTSNGGSNWLNVSLIENDRNYRTLNFSNSNGMMIGGWGIILNTTNSGQNWVNYCPSYRGYEYGDGITCIRFANSRVGYATTDEIILKTTNDGYSWVVLNSPQIYVLSSLSVIDSNIVYAAGGVGSYSEVLKTIDGGLSWSQQNANINAAIFSTYFLNKDTGYCCGPYRVSKTTNGGVNWNGIVLNGNFRSIFFSNDHTGFVVGYNTGFKTIDGGTSWLPISQGGGDILFVNSNVGYLVYDTQIKKTTNGGTTWTTQFICGGSLLDLHFLNELTGYAAGNMGSIIKTTNGGINWIKQRNITNNNLRSVFAIDSNICYVAGAGKTILKTTTGGEPIGIESIDNNIPSKFKLSQNYPNPFNPTTKIRFDIPNEKGHNAVTKLIFYDILGREVMTLVNEQLKPGTYEVDWDGSNYSSGVYFYKLISGDFVQTKKMVLFK